MKKQLLVVIGLVALFTVLIILVIAGKSKDADGTDVKNMSEQKVTEVQEQIGEQTEEQQDEQSTAEVMPDNKNRTEIIPKVEASYEEWLAAGMVLAISMHYMDFEIENIYLASETVQENSLASNGAYIVFQTGGRRVVIQSLPLEGERTTPQTIDLYTPDLGFATFDEVSESAVDISSYTEVAIEDIEELISQSLLVTLYER